MLIAKSAARAAGAEDPVRIAWQPVLLSCLGSGLIEFTGSFVAEYLRRVAPRATLLSTLIGMALGFISLDAGRHRVGPLRWLARGGVLRVPRSDY
ncbi:MAG: hypothetical protein ACRESZ_04915 [Methylococcales bacterium]